MFDPCNSNAYLPPGSDLYPDELLSQESPTDFLTPLARFTAWFCSGVAITLLVRLLPTLQPFYWIVAIGGIISLAIALYFSRNIKLVAIAILLVAATLAGHWDGLSYQAQQTTQQLQEVLK